MLPQRETSLLILRRAGELLLEKRPAPGIWGGLWCFPEIDAERLVWTSVKPARGARRLEFARCFVRVVLDIDRRRDMVGPLTLRSAGRSHEIGRFLGGEERRAFAAALAAALAR